MTQTPTNPPSGLSKEALQAVRIKDSEWTDEQIRETSFGHLVLERRSLLHAYDSLASTLAERAAEVERLTADAVERDKFHTQLNDLMTEYDCPTGTVKIEWLRARLMELFEKRAELAALRAPGDDVEALLPEFRGRACNIMSVQIVCWESTTAELKGAWRVLLSDFYSRVRSPLLAQLAELEKAKEAAERERDAKEIQLQTIRAMCFGGMMPEGWSLDGIVGEIHQGIIAHDKAKTNAEVKASEQAIARRVADEDRDASKAEADALRTRLAEVERTIKDAPAVLKEAGELLIAANQEQTAAECIFLACQIENIAPTPPGAEPGEHSGEAKKFAPVFLCPKCNDVIEPIEVTDRCPECGDIEMVTGSDEEGEYKYCGNEDCEWESRKTVKPVAGRCPKCNTREGVHGGCDCGYLKAWTAAPAAPPAEAKGRKIVFEFDERSVETIESLRARGVEVLVIDQAGLAKCVGQAAKTQGAG